jgi:hypothetical protein
MSRYAKLTIGLIAAWFAFALSSSAMHLFQSAPGQPPLPLGLAALGPILVFLVWFAASSQFRKFLFSLSPQALTMVQTLRIVGYVFLVLATYGILPKVFALSAGWGDIAVGFTAALVALNLANASHRLSFIAWQLLGIADLVVAVSLGTLSQIINPHGIPTSAMAALPLSLVPTFAVPLFLILHIVCIAQAVRWPAQQAQPASPQRRPVTA